MKGYVIAVRDRHGLAVRLHRVLADSYDHAERTARQLVPGGEVVASAHVFREDWEATEHAVLIAVLAAGGKG